LICLVAVGSEIFRSSASRNALLRITDSVPSPSKGRNCSPAESRSPLRREPPGPQARRSGVRRAVPRSRWDERAPGCQEEIQARLKEADQLRFHPTSSCTQDLPPTGIARFFLSFESTQRILTSEISTGGENWW
jgi:hypothetical protein